MAQERERRESAGRPRDEWVFTPPEDHAAARNARRREAGNRARVAARCAKQQEEIEARSRMLAQQAEDQSEEELKRLGAFGCNLF